MLAVALATSHKRTKDGNLTNEACCLMTTGCDCLNLHPWVDGHRLHLEVQELVVFGMAVCPRAENGHGTVRSTPHLRKINTAVTFFDLRRFCVDRDRFYHLVCFSFSWVAFGLCKYCTDHHGKPFGGSVRLRVGLQPYSLLSRVSFTCEKVPLQTHLYSPTSAHSLL